jgi:2-polyprenyl-3-methyl-5-hydroxy-6-metoxy-1,4-benzoquinol methylase
MWMNFKNLVIKASGCKHRHDKVIEIVDAFARKGRLLDAGAREGNISRKLYENGFDVVAADINVLDSAFRTIPWIIANFNHPLPFKNQSFDVVTSSNTIEYLEDQYGFIRECYRVLRREGLLLIETPNILNLQARIAICLTGFHRFSGIPYDEVSEGVFGERRWNLKSYFQLRAILHRNGFRIILATTHEFSNKAMFLFPLSLYLSRMAHHAFRRERNPIQRERNNEILKHVMSADLILGKQLYILAVKDPSYVKHK